MEYLSEENKINKLAHSFRNTRNQTNRSIHLEMIKAVLYLNSVYGNDTDKIDMILEYAKKRSLYNPEVKECHH